MTATLAYLVARAREPSTHAGIAALLGALALLFPGHGPLFAVFAAVFAIIAGATPDTTSTATQAPASAIAAEVQSSKEAT